MQTFNEKIAEEMNHVKLLIAIKASYQVRRKIKVGTVVTENVL